MFLAHITSTPVNQTTDHLILDIKSLNSKSKYYHNDNGNSVPLKDDVIAQTNHSSNYIYIYTIYFYCIHY